MRIREVEILTGLNRKAIRLYEDKGLLAVERSDNDYREYTAEDISRLRRIAVLRRAGISLADIQLWQNRVITGKEMLDKRLSELRDAALPSAGSVTPPCIGRISIGTPPSPCPWSTACVP